MIKQIAQKPLVRFIGLLQLIVLITSPYVAAESIMVDYQLPPLVRTPDDSQERQSVLASQCMRRISALSLSFSLIEDPYLYTKRLREHILELVDTSENFNKVNVFFGKTTRELNDFIAASSAGATIIVPALRLTFSGTVRLKSGITVLGSQTFISDVGEIDRVFVAEGEENISLAGFFLSNAAVGLYLKDCQNFYVHDLKFENTGRGIIIQGESGPGVIADVRMNGSLNSGLSIIGPVRFVMVKNSVFSQGRDYFNWHAGMVITDTPISGWFENENEFSSRAVQTSIEEATAASPRRNIIQNCIFKDNKSSGLYMDGGTANVILSNTFKNNDKEGLCLDGGSSLNVVMNNTIDSNGFRRRQSDEDLRKDFVLSLGRLADGSSVAKLPGISLDNAACNLILENALRHNAGDGIKIVRSGFRNIIMFNNILNNNQGRNSVFHFFGVLIGNAPSDADSEKGLYDFIPAMENIVAANVIYGKHYSGVLLDRETAFNDVYDNVIYKFRHVAVESASQKFNSVIANNAPEKVSVNAGFYQSLPIMMVYAAGLILVSTILCFSIIAIRRRKVKK